MAVMNKEVKGKDDTRRDDKRGADVAAEGGDDSLAPEGC